MNTTPRTRCRELIARASQAGVTLSVSKDEFSTGAEIVVRTQNVEKQFASWVLVEAYLQGVLAGVDLRPQTA